MHHIHSYLTSVQRLSIYGIPDHLAVRDRDVGTTPTGIHSGVVSISDVSMPISGEYIVYTELLLFEQARCWLYYSCGGESLTSLPSLLQVQCD